LLVARRPRFAGVLADYERVLKQRNALLRTAHLARRTGGAADLSTLEVWDTHLVRHGAELTAGRLELVAALRPHVADAYRAVAATDAGGRAGAELSYRGSVPVEAEQAVDREQLAAGLAGALAQARPVDVERGVTTVGPHRDDLLLALDGLPA